MQRCSNPRSGGRSLTPLRRRVASDTPEVWRGVIDRSTMDLDPARMARPCELDFLALTADVLAALEFAQAGAERAHL